MPRLPSEYQQLLSTPLPLAVQQCNSTYQLFKKYLLNSPPSTSKLKLKDDKTTLSILSYLFGIQLIRILMTEYESFLISDVDKAVILTVLNNVISILESLKAKKLKSDSKPSLFKKFNSNSNFNSNSSKPKFSDIINDDEKSRLFLNDWCLSKLLEIKRIFTDGTVNGDTVDLLMDCSVGFQVILGLFPIDEKAAEIQNLENEIEIESQDSFKDINVSKKDGGEKLDTKNSHNSIEKTKEEQEIQDFEEIDIKRESEYFEDKLKLAENELTKPIIQQIIPINEENDDQIKEHPLSKEDILAKIKWCNYHISRIMKCLKEGKDPNEDFVGLLTQPSSNELKISQSEIDVVIKEALEMKDLNENDDDNDTDEFKEEDYYYDSDEGKYIHKNRFKEMESQFPSTPENHPQISQPSQPDRNSTSESLSNDNKKKPKKKSRDSLLRKKLTPADMVAKNLLSTNKIPVKPMDLKTLEKQMANSDLLNSANKCCKFAISAINYEDAVTAIAELKEAMHLLEEYQNKVQNFT